MSTALAAYRLRRDTTERGPLAGRACSSDLPTRRACMATEAQLALQQLSLTLSRTDGAAAQPRAPTASPSCSTRSWSLASPGRPLSRRAGRQAQNGSKIERRRSAWGGPSRVAPSTPRFLKLFAPSIIVTRTHSASEAASMALVGSLIESAISSDAALTSLLEEIGEEVTTRPSSAALTRRSSLFANAAAAGLRLSASAEAEGSYTATEIARARLSAEQLDRPWEVPGVVSGLLALMDDDHSPPVLRCAAAAALQTIAADQPGGTAVLSAGGAPPLRRALALQRAAGSGAAYSAAPCGAGLQGRLQARLQGHAAHAVCNLAMHRNLARTLLSQGLLPSLLDVLLAPGVHDGTSHGTSHGTSEHPEHDHAPGLGVGVLRGSDVHALTLEAPVCTTLYILATTYLRSPYSPPTLTYY